MRLCASDVEGIKVQLAELRRVGGQVEGMDLPAMNRVVAHRPEDLTVTVEAGMTLAGLQAHLARSGQWLPIDPPGAERLSVGALIADNVSGSRRYGYGTIREHLIGLAVVLADGRLVRSGGRVVKNVAGYDVQKLLVGSRGSLGVIVEATFKVAPLPELERIVQARCDTLADAGGLLERVWDGALTPTLMDLHNLEGEEAAESLRLVLGFAGSREAVEDQLERARRLGIGEATGLDAQTRFWSVAGSARVVSVLPSRTIETLKGLDGAQFLAHAGNGVIRYRGGVEPQPAVLPWALLRRVKDAFDPEGTFPALPWRESP
jgi:glycolate oxidase FAD binding subunit